MTDLQRVDNVSVNRYYFPGQKTKVKSALLHGFGDASKGAYCAVAYLCIESEDKYRTSLVAAKTRVAPSTPMTIPRLKLLAALILAPLISAVREALTQVIHIEEVFCWTDSITVFHWIQSDKEFKQFVQNRIEEIHKLTDVKSWRHCPGIENPADIGSRGCLASELVSSSLWWKGPAWLQSYPEVTEEPLMPSHLVIGRRLNTLPDRTELSDNEDCASKLQQKARHLSKLIEHFRKRWTKEYLIGLREFHHCGTQEDHDRKIKIGNVILIHDENLPRRNWRLGEATELIESKDGCERGAVLRVASKKGKHLKLRRPIQKLVPLEVSTGKPPEKRNVGAVQQPEPHPETSRPPRRAAAATADMIRRQIGRAHV